jgi:hypothetical protein
MERTRIVWIVTTGEREILFIFLRFGVAKS